MGVGAGGFVTSEGHGSNGFFSTVLEGVGEGLGRVTSEILPVWTAQQLGVQERDTTAAPTFDSRSAPPRSDGVTPGGAPVQRTFLDNSFNLTSGGLLTLAIVAVTVVLAVRLLR